MPGECIHLLPMNKYFQLSNHIHVGAERPRDGVYRQLFALNSGRSLRRQRIRKIRDARAIRLQVERQQYRIGRQRTLTRRWSIRYQRDQELFRAFHRIRR